MSKSAVVMVATTVLCLSGCSRIISSFRNYSSNGNAEIHAAFQAKASAKSFRMTTQIAVHDNSVMETDFYISCPDRQRITMTMSEITREMIRIGQRFYINENGTWYFKDVAMEVKDWSPCGENPGLPSPWALLTEGRDFLAVFARAKDKLSVEPAEPINYNGIEHKAWSVSSREGVPGSSIRYTVLLDDDHRPLLILAGRTSLTQYSAWNEPIRIEPPVGALPYPENPR